MAGLGFARSQLEKHGWAEGKGLGKEEDGIKKAIKVGIKNDTQGVGYKISDQFTFHWWDHVFNKTAKSIVVKEHEDGVQVTKDGTSNQPISSKRPNKHSQKTLLYGRFVKASTATSSGDVESSGTESTDGEAEKDFSSKHPEDIVFNACGGRTAHKGARHGLKLNGKLKRIEEQERIALSAPCSRSASPDITTEHDIGQKTAELLDQLKSNKKKRKVKDDVKSYSDSEGCVVKKKKKRKRNRAEKVDIENESSGTGKSKKSGRTETEENVNSEKEESYSCSNRERIKKKKKEKKKKDGNKKDKAEKKKKSQSSTDEESLETNLNDSKGEKTQDSYEKEKNKPDNLKTEEKSSFTEDKERRKAMKRKAKDIKNETDKTKDDKKDILTENEESSTTKKKKKRKNK